MTGTNQCPHCGKPVPTTALGGLCPECMLKAGVATEGGEVGPNGTHVIKPPPQAALAPAEIAGHFPHLEILECLGRGGMGVVYRARQPKLNRLVALKILAPEKESDPKFAERFTREAQALAGLNHPNIVTVHDFGEADGLYYLLMEYVDGASLRELLRAGRMKPEEALAIVPRICEALQFAHERGVVHRDIKPENVLLDRDGRVKIADFGIAKIVRGNGARAALTEERQVVGTPHYMAPEQVEKPQLVDHRADIYSLGVVFYEMLTGELPLGKFQPPSRKAEVDARLDAVVLHALEKEPERRYQHASEVKTDVETIAGTPTGAATGVERFDGAQRPSGSNLGRFGWGVFATLLPGERVVHFKPRIWGASFKSLPSYRLLFSLPPLWEAAFYVTDRRILIVAHVVALGTQEFSIWFPGNAPAGQGEVLKAVSAGTNGWFGGYVELISEDPKPHWFRSRELRSRFYLREPEVLRETIAAALSRTAHRDAGGGAASEAPAPQQAVLPPRQPHWLGAVRWSARILGTVLLAFYCIFVLAEGLPPLGGQPEGVQLNFAALALMLLGFVVGWKREGAAALLIATGWTLWQVVENSVRWNLLQTPLPVAALYALCWWATQGRKTLRAVTVVAALTAAFGLGRLICPGNVFVQGTVADAATGVPVRNAEVRMAREGSQQRGADKGPNARSGKDGRFALYVGWYAPGKGLTISAPGYETLQTNLGPRPMGQRRLTKEFRMTPLMAGVPPVVVQTMPASGSTGVDPTLMEIRVVFSQAMEGGSWSWVAAAEANNPETTGPPRYLADQRTCVLPVKLQPGRVYAIWLNRETQQNFRSQNGRPAVPYLLIFETAKGNP